MYADYDYYKSTYAGTAIPEEEWPKLARQADAIMDAITFGRLRMGWPVTDAVKMACCAVAEEISTQSAQQARSGAATAAVCGVKAESTDGYSVTYGGYAEMQAAQKVRLWDAAGLYLPPSDPLRYAGFYQRGPGCG